MKKKIISKKKYQNGAFAQTHCRVEGATIPILHAKMTRVLKRQSWWVLLLLLSVLHGSCIRPSTSFAFVPPNKREWRCVSRDYYRHRTITSLFALKNTEKKENNAATTATIFGFPSDVASPLSLLLLSQFILFIGVGAVIPSIPLYGKEIGLSGKLNGIVISAPALAALLGSKLAGNYADIARKPAMILGMAIIVISDIGTALATNLASLTTARLGLGAGRIISESGERGMLADLAGRAPELRGRALAAQQAVIALGIAIGAPAGGVVVEQYGPRASFLCVSAAALVALIMYLFLPETIVSSSTNNSTQDEQSWQAILAGNDDDDNEKQQQGEWAALLKENKWKGLCLCQVGTSFGFATKIASVPILAAATLPGGAIGAGALLSACGLSGLVGAPIGGWLTDRTSAKLTILLSGLMSAAGLFLIPFALNSSLLEGDKTFSILGLSMNEQAAAFSLVVLAWSIGAAAQSPALTALAQEIAPAGAEATAMALPRAAGDGTYIVAPFFLGIVSDMVPTLPGVDCAVAGIVGFIGVLALAILDNEEKK